MSAACRVAARAAVSFHGSGGRPCSFRSRFTRPSAYFSATARVIRPGRAPGGGSPAIGSPPPPGGTLAPAPSPPAPPHATASVETTRALDHLMGLSSASRTLRLTDGDGDRRPRAAGALRAAD